MRFKSLFLACLLMLASALPALAVGPTLNLGTVSGTPGQNVTVPITLTNNGATISSLAIDIAYDPAVLTPVAIAPATKAGVIGAAGTAAGKMLTQSQISAGLYRIGVTSLADTNLIGDGVVATISFAVTAGASGNVALTNTPSASNANGDTVAITGANGQVTLPVVLPTITAFTIPATGTSLAVTFTTLTGSANTAAYLVTESTTKPLAGDTNWKTTKPTNYTFTTYGAKTLNAWAKDAGGNISAAAVSAQTTLTEPVATVTAFSIPSTSYSLVIPVTTFTASANAVAFLVNESATAPAASAITATSPPTTFTVIGFTAHTLYAWVKNASGVVSAPFAGATTTVSAKPAPVLTITAPTNNYVTGVSTVAVTGTATQNPAAGSGPVAGVTVNGAVVTLGAGGAFSTTVTLTEGANTITVVASDNQVPAVTATSSVAVNYDVIKPALTVTSPPEGIKTKASPVNISGTVSDANGIKLLTINGTTVAVASGAFSYALPLALPEGDKVITVVATDNVNNTQTVTRTIVYDITPMTLTVIAPADNSQTKDATLTVSGTVSEAGATVAIKNTTNSTTATNVIVTGTNYTGTIQLVSGSNGLQVTVTDAAGNESTAVSRTVLSDPNSPALAITEPAQDIQLQVTSVTIKGTVTDATTTTVKLRFNGVDYPQTVTAGAFQQAITIPAEGSFPVVVTATDAVGNTPTTVTRNIIYTTHPTDSDADGQTTKLVEVLRAFQSTLGIGAPLTDTEKVRLDCAPLGADGKPTPNGVIDGGDVILLLRRAAGLVNW